ncbi:hypothetical protein Paes_0525 [Prosthecochloris aestuarii DSM 271]|uniref:Uncharacterized protein n=1 Tax=Prosthecochloris aestuarii (strain DSM 271 / SK 413) TaxID=290512 RepID=B4S5I4_PROA2|nr:hypothetical protein Paes_0525 [Prosthecochloris aestuarii DSM 271]
MCIRTTFRKPDAEAHAPLLSGSTTSQIFDSKNLPAAMLPLLEMEKNDTVFLQKALNAINKAANQFV